jgi:hypothetical protein
VKGRVSASAALCVLSLSFAWSSVGRADEESKRNCASAFTSGQRLMRAGRLHEARSKFLLCGGPQCPEVMHPDCQQWLTEVEASSPTVVFQVATPAAQPVEDVQLSVDGGEQVALDGRAMGMDPGAHDITFGAPGFQTTTKHIVVSEGEKLRRELVTLDRLPVVQPTQPSPPPVVGTVREQSTGPRHRRMTVPVVIAASVSVLAGAGAIYFGVKARSADRALDGCAASSSCSTSAVDHVRNEYLWTNLSIGAAGVGIATTVVLYLLGGEPAGKPRQTAFGIEPRAGGLATTVTGRF